MTDDTKLPLTSADMTEALLTQLRDAAPQIFSEGRVDFAKLQAALGEYIETNPERYGLTWAGKREAFRNVQMPSVATLRPQPGESVNWDSTENLIIEGDNLEVLKLLQKPYHAKVKMIYIDPPYNTGNEFIYPDNFREGLDEYLRYTGQLGEDGTATSTNKDTSGRYHSNWLNMMYPRLFLARNLLKEDGVIFVSIDDHEVHNLRLLMDEVFGEECWLATIVWHNSSRNSEQIAVEHEYIHVYGRAPSASDSKWNRSRDDGERLNHLVHEMKINGVSLAEAQEKLTAEINILLEEDAHRGEKKHAWLGNYKNIDEQWNVYYAVDLSGEGSGPPRRFGDRTIPAPPGRHWMGQDYIDELLADNRVVWRGDRAYRKLYIQESLDNLKSVIRIPTRNGSEMLKQILGRDVFDKPKPHNLIKHLIYFVTEKESDIVLDFFAGSGTTAHAVFDLNQQDGGKRKFILVQLPEKTDHPQYLTIAHITRERVRRVIAKLNQQAAEISPQLSLTPSPSPAGRGESNPRPLGEGGRRSGEGDLGFRAFKLASSNFKIWRSDQAPQSAEQLTEQLKLYADNVLTERGDQDRLYELILKCGIPLSARVESIAIGQRTAFAISDGNLLICLEPHLDRDMLRTLFARKPQMVLCLDTAFDGNDALKTNTVLEAQTHGIIFKTV
ncbi:MAG: site-specific DNA-methyltransferase [Candidatus Nitrotoga sp.]